MISFALGVAFGIVYSLLCYRLYQLDKANRKDRDKHSGESTEKED